VGVSQGIDQGYDGPRISELSQSPRRRLANRENQS
jgi:hypothetical protein